jgi:hypothetical protein
MASKERSTLKIKNFVFSLIFRSIVACFFLALGITSIIYGAIIVAKMIAAQKEFFYNATSDAFRLAVSFLFSVVFIMLGIDRIIKIRRTIKNEKFLKGLVEG